MRAHEEAGAVGGSFSSRVLSFVLVLAASTASTVLAGCSEELPSQIALSPQGEQIETSDEPMPADQYKELGDVTGEGIGPSPRDAEINALNDLRNRTSAMGGTFVSIGSRSTEAYGYFSGQVKLSIKGVAYSPRPE